MLEEKGVELWKALNKNEDLLTSKSQEIQEKKGAITRMVSSGIGFDEFLSFSQDDEIEEKIKAKEQQLAAATQATTLKNTSYLFPLNVYSLPIPLYETVLKSTLGGLVVEAQKAIHVHIKHCMDDSGEQWLATGAPFVKGNVCPFCGQEIKDAKLIDSYRQYFDEVYIRFKESLIDWCAGLKKGCEVNHVKASLAQADVNAARIETWSPYLTLELPEVSKESLVSLANTLVSMLDRCGQMKMQAPLEAIAISDEVHKEIENFNAEMNRLVVYNEGVMNANRLISDYKAKLTLSDAEKLRRELKLLQDQKTRYKNAAASCDAYSVLLGMKKGLEKQKSKLKEDLDAHSSKIIPAYQKGINDHLVSFGAGFKLCNVGQNYVGKKPTSNYCIEINSTKVELGNEETPEDIPMPGFGNTLSAGDKSALAFAFFLARLDRDVGLANKVIVFDDPISSLDNNRKAFTRSNILRLSATARQVIVLTHDPMYAWELFDEAKKKKLNPTAVKIVSVGEGSGLSEWNIKWETSSDHYKAYTNIDAFLNKGSPSQDGLKEVVNLVRPLVEGSMRHRFPIAFDSETGLGQMIKKIREADDADAIVILKPLLSKMEQINSYGTPVHHSGRGGERTFVIDENELRVHCRLALELSHGLVEVIGDVADKN